MACARKAKSHFIMLVSLLCSFWYLTACSSFSDSTTQKNNQEKFKLENNQSSTTQETSASFVGIEQMKEERIQFIFNEGRIIVLLENNPVSQDLLTQLPLTLTFEDFAAAEKIAYLEEKLTIEGIAATQPEIGDFSLYTPWMTLVFYYDTEGNYPNNIIKLGTIESGMEYLKKLSGEVTIDVLD